MLKIYGVTKFEKCIVAYKFHDSEDKVILSDGTKTRTVPMQKWVDDNKHYFKSELKYIKCHKDKTVEQTALDFVRDADVLKKETDGLINMFKSGSVPRTSLALFNHFNEVIPEKITPDEGAWLTAATLGAIAWCKPYNGPIWKYDYVSMYPSIMQNNNMLFPVKQGRFETIEKFDKDHAVAIYRCHIDGESKLFRFNPKKNYYTSHDVRRARELNLKISLIHDKKPNVLIYDRQTCMTGAQLFRKYVNFLFALKKKKVPVSKDILNNLWGALTRKDVIKKIFHQSDDVKVFPGRTIIDRQMYGDDQWEYTFVCDNSIYKYDWARIGPFLLAKGRSMISKLMEPHIDCIVKSHTDSMWCTKQLEIPTGEGLGEVKYEGFCPDAKIVNNVNFSGKFSV